ncbi:disease resistance protein RPV1-like isoform X2 [Gossypium arboreum]|uniref:disease resistance protein RPV1-like isoform X2 n=1 Tax=Gossypium arboreum TaxID=29729 RepID=UPI0022F162C1|nr:disease resistance protein RPV1-like isoform X2 [Gossypium arboreum]
MFYTFSSTIIPQPKQNSLAIFVLSFASRYSFMSSSSSSSTLMKYHVFLSFRGEDTRLNFTSHLLQALKNYASSKSCLVELSDIMIRKRSHGHTVIPIFYHVDPSNVRNIGGSFKTSFEEHESKQPTDTVQRWKSAFAEVGKLKGWHIEGGKFDRPETEYIKDVVEYIIKKLTNIEFESASEELVGIDDQKKIILGLIEQEGCRVLGLWGMGGQGKTTLAEVVYKKISSEFESHCFLQNVREEIGNQGKKSLRNELLSKLLNSKVDIDTPSIGSTLTQERLNKKKVLVVLDDVDDHLDQIDYMGVKYFGFGSKTIITSRDRQVLESGGADKIHEMKGLNENDSLQLFSTFAFKQLNPAVGFQDLSRRFVKYTQGNPLALKVLGSDLNKRSIDYWESKVEKLKDCPPEKKISEALKSSYDGLDIVEQNIFLDIACFFKGEPIETTKHILSGCYKGVECGINKLVDKCLIKRTKHILSGCYQGLECEVNKLVDKCQINVSSSHNFSLGYLTMCDFGYSYIIYMHDTLEEMGKDIACQESKTLGKCSRLWNVKHVEEVLKYKKGTDRIQGIKSDMIRMDNLLFQPSVFKNMTNLRYIFFYSSSKYLLREESEDYKKLFTYQDDIVFFPDELRYLRWDYYPFKSLSSSFNPKNLIALILPHGNMEHLWNKDQDLVHLRKINLFSCKKLKKIPNLLKAVNLERLDCENCESLVELPCLDHLTSLKTLHLKGCRSLKKFPEILNNFYRLDLSETGIEEVPDFIEHLHRLGKLILRNSRVKDVSSNISKLESLSSLHLSGCPIVKFPAVDVPSPSLRFKSLKYMHMDRCKSLKLLSELPPYLHDLNVHDCTSLEKVSFADKNLYQFVSLGDDNDDNVFLMLFCNCFNLNQESTNNIEANAMLKIGSLAKEWASRYDWKYQHDNFPSLICCFPGNKISANKFECQSMNSSLSLKIAPNGGSGSRVLVFAICLVADLTHCLEFQLLECICEYQFTAAGGGNGGGGYEKLRSKISFLELLEPEKCMGDHVFILSSIDMVKEDQNYEEASFEFYIRNWDEEEDDGEEDYIKVKRCGVHVFYVDATEVAGNKRSFSHDGEEGDGGDGGFRMGLDWRCVYVDYMDCTEKRVAGNKRSITCVRRKIS